MEIKQNFFEALGKGKKFFPVIRALSIDHVASDMRVIDTAGIEGVFLKRHTVREHAISVRELCHIYSTISAHYMEPFFGICPNTTYTGRDFHTVQQQNYVDAFWATESGFDRQGLTFDPYNVWLMSRTWSGHYFAEICLDHIRDEVHLVEVVCAAADLTDVIVVRGNRKNALPNLDAISVIKRIIPNHPIAIVGMMKPENIKPYLPLADIFIADQGIYEKGHRLSKARVTALNKIIQSVPLPV